MKQSSAKKLYNKSIKSGDNLNLLKLAINEIKRNCKRGQPFSNLVIDKSLDVEKLKIDLETLGYDVHYNKTDSTTIVIWVCLKNQALF